MKQVNFIKIFFILFLFVVITAISSLHFSLITHFYADNLFTSFVHDLSKSRNFFEILIQKYNIYGIPLIPFNSNLNLLSHFNYDLNSNYGYLLYLFLLKILELVPFLLYVFYFSKTKIKLTSILIFLLFIYQFNIFDHQSYVNFPILIFNIGVALSLIFQNNIKLFLFFFQ